MFANPGAGGAAAQDDSGTVMAALGGLGALMLLCGLLAELCKRDAAAHMMQKKVHSALQVGP